MKATYNFLPFFEYFLLFLYLQICKTQVSPFLDPLCSSLTTPQLLLLLFQSRFSHRLFLAHLTNVSLHNYYSFLLSSPLCRATVIAYLAYLLLSVSVTYQRSPSNIMYVFSIFPLLSLLYLFFCIFLTKLFLRYFYRFYSYR